MGLMDMFKANEYKKRITELETELTNIKNTITPEMQDLLNLKKITSDLNTQSHTLQAKISADKKRLAELNDEIHEKIKTQSDIKSIEDIERQIVQKHAELNKLNETILKQQQELVQVNEEVLLQSFGLYKPTYDFTNSEEYNARLKDIRQKQKDMIKDNSATFGNLDWTVNGSNSQGQKMVRDMQKLLLRAFNSECDEAIEKVKYNTYETAKKRITSSYNAISKLGKIMDVSISPLYYNSKLEELTLALEYRIKKQEEKELQKELRAQMREEAKLQKEIEAQRKKTEKEQSHYKNALEKILEQLSSASEQEQSELLEKKLEIEAKLTEINKAISDIDYREANQRAGYVYIISNVGSFGENIYKIGMTRRLDPTERVDELGDASVPFNFDIHAMIFSDDAPKLENALHKAFESRKLNMVNQRREFFSVSLDEIKEVVRKNFDKTVEFIDVAEAEQYRISEKMRTTLNN